eukprot:TRINITY_DN5735_c0_g2_i1.p1 TRINITY_DN5735_c0_g2~~TRINITY_DN5735_c0_g2_i1.p1  ORF type:complete len:1228 (-),score=198.13 TRINITY_DN5735_c0_g2_i1:145-3573(-)
MEVSNLWDSDTVGPLQVAALGGAPPAFLSKLVNLHPESAAVPVSRNLPLLHFLLMNQPIQPSSKTRREWSKLVLDVLVAHQEAAQLRGPGGFFPIWLALQTCCDDEDVKMLTCLAEANRSAVEACQETLCGAEAGKGSVVSLEAVVRRIVDLLSSARTCFWELRRGCWCDSVAFIARLTRTPRLAQLRVVGEYLLWWAIFFGAPASVAQALLRINPSAVLAERAANGGAPVLQLALVHQYSASLVAEIVRVDPRALAEKVDERLPACVRGRGRGSSTFLGIASTVSGGNSLHLALAMQCDCRTLEVLLDEIGDGAGVEEGVEGAGSKRSLLIMAMRLKHLNDALLRRLLGDRAPEATIVTTLLEIAASDELRRELSRRNVELVMSLCPRAAHTATGSHALQQELKKGRGADVHRVQDILATYGCAVAAIPVSFKGLSRRSQMVVNRFFSYSSSSEFEAVKRWPLQIALLLGNPPEVGRVLLQAFPEIARQPLVGSPDMSGCNIQTRHFLVQHVVLWMKEVFRNCSRQTLDTMSQTKGWLQLGLEVVDVAPEVLTSRLPEILEAEMGGSLDLKIWGSSAVCGSSASAKQLPIIFELLDMGRDTLEFCWPLFRHLICCVPEVLTPRLNGRTSLVAGIEAGASPEMLNLMLDAAPDLAGEVCGSEGSAFGYLLKVHSNASSSSAQYFSAPAGDWDRQRLLWLGHIRSTHKTSSRPPCPFGLLAETTIRRICACLGRPSVAARLFAAAPDVVSKADAKRVVATTLCSIQRPFATSLLHQLFAKHPSLAKEGIIVDDLPRTSNGQHSCRWRCPPLHAVLMNRETRAPRLAERLVELDPQAASVVDLMGQLPIVHVLRLQAPWCKVRALAELLLLHTPERKVTTCQGTLGPPPPVTASARNGYLDASDARGSGSGCVAVPPLLVGLRNDNVPAEFLMQLVAKRPADLLVREVGSGASAMELGLRRADAGELVPQLLQAPGGEALALAPISLDAFLEIGRKSRLPAALALHLQSVPAALLPLLQASIHSLPRLSGALTAQRGAGWKTSAATAKDDESGGAKGNLRRQSWCRCPGRDLGGDVDTMTAKHLANELLGPETSVSSAQTAADVAETTVVEAARRAWAEDLDQAYEEYYDGANSIASSSPRSFF